MILAGEAPVSRPGTYTAVSQSTRPREKGMIIRGIVSMAFAANWLMAAEADQTMLRLIGQDVKAIYGVDVDRYRTTTLAKLFPLWIEGESDLVGLSQVIVNEGS